MDHFNISKLGLWESCHHYLSLVFPSSSVSPLSSCGPNIPMWHPIHFVKPLPCALWFKFQQKNLSFSLWEFQIDVQRNIGSGQKQEVQATKTQGSRYSEVGWHAMRRGFCPSTGLSLASPSPSPVSSDPELDLALQEMVSRVPSVEALEIGIVIVLYFHKLLWYVVKA